MEVSPYLDLECERSCLEIVGALYYHNDWRSGTTNGIIEKFAALNDASDHPLPAFGILKQPKTTISDEIRDTL